jgi:hypothetical protein
MAEGIVVPGISTPDQGSSGIASKVVDIPQQPPISLSVLVARGRFKRMEPSTSRFMTLSLAPPPHSLGSGASTPMNLTYSPEPQAQGVAINHILQLSSSGRHRCSR